MGSLLKSVSAYDMYRKKYGKLSLRVLQNFDSWSRISKIYTCLSTNCWALTLSGSSVGFSNAHKTLGALRSQLEYIEIDEL
jgi:hypothetical protein